MQVSECALVLLCLLCCTGELLGVPVTQVGLNVVLHTLAHAGIDISGARSPEEVQKCIRQNFEDLGARKSSLIVLALVITKD